MIVEPDFLDHWKTRLLVRLLNTETAPIHVLRLWAHCQSRKTDRFTGWLPEVLSSVCRWDGDAQLFWNSMLQTYCEIDQNELVVHGWADVNASLISAWNNGKKGGRPKSKSTNENPSVIRPVTDRVSDREDKIEKIEKKKERCSEVSPWSVGLGVELPAALQTIECLAAVKLWLQYKSERRESYKLTGLTTALKKWERDFGSIELPKAIERAMSQNWAGIHQDRESSATKSTMPTPAGQEWRKDPTDWRQSL